MALRKHRLALGLAALAGSAAMLAVTAPAQAAPAPGDPATWPCDPSEFCIYHDGQGGGAHYSLADGASDLGVLAGGLNDHVWSVKNISGSRWCLYKDADYENEIQVILDGQAIDLASPVRDQVSSVKEC
ncbi:MULTISPECIES: peptidase inhibitor family I36 protein [unclassified Streptomyces]|uniref:peptidase inhibitor family I36 protein n=1 Tax=unclassified Streptomyces TaxID=2593676 RepID=UPI00224F5307|nr:MULTISPECIES: peptidase inhibitor family I36 protein [unclassified Streptomyces]MCX5047921.1 peptidase inhibitor family I36 protein [Streptomyces sp. NBC_00474]MCX5057376.1 peptidase inhibitor family I36 protein [Streptomyces sp. NBC_00452]MCX5245748.1 peptidase inhibitor family I36 protein [Streptomyces sp. NBC_00201]MCX5288450.1 peptidase inhibitor family I36 protein [Streptomyces sp. NBC_00183]